MLTLPLVSLLAALCVSADLMSRHGPRWRF
jgi:hypothetical protein